MIYLDTHVVAWLYAGRVELLSEVAMQHIEKSEIRVSPIVHLELQYLFELKRVDQPAQIVIDALQREIGLQTCDLPFSLVVGRGLAESWTRDPFDRLIVSQARVRDALLLSKDREILVHYPHAVWGT